MLCEFLASHGYIVLGSAYQKPDGSSFGVDGSETSVRDLEFLIAYAKQLPGVDWNHISVIGHSGGAHAALMFRAQSHCAADAIVSLDTTQDYFSLTDYRWEAMTSAVVKNRKHMTGPLLMVANPHGFFELADSLSSARRSLSHHQGPGSQRLYFSGSHQQRPPLSAPSQGCEADSGKPRHGKSQPRPVNAGYESLCNYVLHFLDAELKGDATGKNFLMKQYRDTRLGGDKPHVDYMPEGKTNPDPYKEDSHPSTNPAAASARSSKHGTDKTIAMLKRFQKDSASQPIYHHVFARR